LVEKLADIREKKNKLVVLFLKKRVQLELKSFLNCHSLWSSLRFTTPLIFTIGFLALFYNRRFNWSNLANASLDLALHDIKISFSHYPYLEILTVCPLSVLNLKTPASLLASDRDGFVVGLIDGDGSIQVNH